MRDLKKGWLAGWLGGGGGGAAARGHMPQNWGLIVIWKRKGKKYSGV